MQIKRASRSNDHDLGDTTYNIKRAKGLPYFHLVFQNISTHRRAMALVWIYEKDLFAGGKSFIFHNVARIQPLLHSKRCCIAT